MPTGTVAGGIACGGDADLGDIVPFVVGLAGALCYIGGSEDCVGDSCAVDLACPALPRIPTNTVTSCDRRISRIVDCFGDHGAGVPHRHLTACPIPNIPGHTRTHIICSIRESIRYEHTRHHTLRPRPSERPTRSALTLAVSLGWPDGYRLARTNQCIARSGPCVDSAIRVCLDGGAIDDDFGDAGVGAYADCTDLSEGAVCGTSQNMNDAVAISDENGRVGGDGVRCHGD